MLRADWAQALLRDIGATAKPELGSHVEFSSRSPLPAGLGDLTLSLRYRGDSDFAKKLDRAGE